MATDPLAEDRDQVMLDLRKAGYGDDVLARAREVTDATASIVASRGLRGWEQLAAVRAKYSGEPWWPAIQGEFTGMGAHHSRTEVEAIASDRKSVVTGKSGSVRGAIGGRGTLKK